MRLAAKTGPADIGISLCDFRVATQLGTVWAEECTFKAGIGRQGHFTPF